MADPQIGLQVNIPVMPMQQVQICDQALNLVQVDSLTKDFQQWILYGTLALLAMAVMATLGNMGLIWFHHFRWQIHVGRVMRQIGGFRIPRAAEQDTMPTQDLDRTELRVYAQRVSYMARHPLLFRILDWTSCRLFPKDEDNQSLYFWFAYYIARHEAVVCLFIGLLGLALVYGQIALIQYARDHWQPLLASTLTDLSDEALDFVNGAIQSSSIAFATQTNDALARVESSLNTDVFGEIVQAAAEMDTALNSVQSTLIQGIQAVFGSTLFGKLALAVLQCLLLNKLIIIESGLAWIQQNARISLPRLKDDVLMVNQTLVNQLVNEALALGTSSPATASTAGARTGGILLRKTQVVEEAIGKVFSEYESRLRGELPVFYGLVLAWVAVVVMGAIGTMAIAAMTAGAAGATELIFLGTGTSSGVPSVPCLTDPNPTCKVCLSTLKPEGVKNIKRNTSAMIHFMHKDGRERNILMDCGKSFYESARQWFPAHNLRCIDALVITHGHADAFFGLDDLRSWCLLDKNHPFSIPVYLDQPTMDIIASTFPYMVDATKATGGGDIPSFNYHIINHDEDFEVEGVKFTPLPVHHGKYMSTGEPFWSLGFRFNDLSWVSDCSSIPESTTEKIRGSKVLVIDGLKETTHPSHFSIPEALEYTNGLDPKPERTFIVGFCHSADHYVEDERMKALDGEQSGATIRVAYDGQKITI
ncbi:phosphoribosyl 1,2-cyclic phosphate phosphodiesterase [Entomortierella parvispora]|uniref:Phosphoribosyl 1,2-cyclic phosphate phosphodiesterase n=1 Tax=Entomortierella parvispora TaxID=205924 RepID=A0A9P3H1D5_9FUNG|nr:phosphoribosyl 1,2-cyclic phosphate phosphodiesterase [Entomortierella parvispora]